MRKNPGGIAHEAVDETVAEAAKVARAGPTRDKVRSETEAAETRVAMKDGGDADDADVGVMVNETTPMPTMPSGQENKKKRRLVVKGVRLALGEGARVGGTLDVHPVRL